MATAVEIAEAIKAKFGDVVKEAVVEGALPYAVVEASKVRDVCEFLKSDPAMAFDFVSAIAGVDKGELLESVYLIYSYKNHHSFTVKARVPRTNPTIPSVAGIWPAADWHERETYDLMGIVFEGHPDLRRILLPCDWEGHPLRKDYKYPESYDGVTLRRDEKDWSDPGPEELYKK